MAITPANSVPSTNGRGGLICGAEPTMAGELELWADEAGVPTYLVQVLSLQDLSGFESQMKYR